MPLHSQLVSSFSDTSKPRLYGGLYLLVGGITLGLLALFLFFLASGRTGASLLAWREAASAIGAVALTTFFVGVAVALPAPRSMRITMGVGIAFCVTAIILFMVHYPYHFNLGDSGLPGQADYTSIDVGIFALGLAGIIAGTFSSVIGYYVSRITTARAEADVEDAFGPGYSVPDWLVEKDLEEAGKQHRFSWGDGRTQAAHEHIQMNIGARFEEMMTVGGKGGPRRTTIDATQVATAEAALIQDRSASRPTLPGAWADDGAAALRAFRSRQAAAPTVFAPRTRWYQRLRDRLFGRPDARA